MTGKQLKNSILQWAIQGKLVPQDPNDEPASVLLERIREEKARLIKEKKIKKDKNESIIYRGDDNSHYEKILATGEVKCIDNEIPFEIPDSWMWCRLRNIQYLLTDGTHNRPEYTEQGIPFVSVKDISQGRLDLSNTKYISLSSHKELSKRCNPQKGDLLISKVGTTGVPVIIDTDKPFSLFVSVALMKYFATYTLPKFLIYLINSPLVQTQVKENTRGVGNKNWVLNDIYNTLIVLPPIAEQQRIVCEIDEMMPIVAKYNKSQKELDILNADISEQLKKSILQEAIQGRLVAQDSTDEPAIVLLERIREEKKKLVASGKLKKKDLTDSTIFKGDDNKYYEQIGGKCIDVTEEIPFDIPNSWEWCRLSQLARLITGTSYNKSDVCKDGIRILRGGNIQETKLLTYDNDVFLPYSYADENKQIRVNDIIIVGSTGSKEVIGKPAFITVQCADTQIGAFLRIVRPYREYYAPYLKILFSSDYYRKHIRTNVKGTNINNIKAEHIDNLLVPLPPLKEIERIVAKKEELHRKL